jgi:ABC-type phosphate transport system substrate-binding protein
MLRSIGFSRWICEQLRAKTQSTKTKLMRPRVAYLAAALMMCLPAYADVVVIVHPSNQATMTDMNIREIFLGNVRNFPDGARAIPVLQVEGPTVEEFHTQVLRKKPYDVRRTWARHVFTSGAQPPHTLNSDDEVLNFVSSTPGAIGFVDADKANASVKVVKLISALKK